MRRALIAVGFISGQAIAYTWLNQAAEISIAIAVGGTMALVADSVIEWLQS